MILDKICATFAILLGSSSVSKQERIRGSVVMCFADEVEKESNLCPHERPPFPFAITLTNRQQ